MERIETPPEATVEREYPTAVVTVRMLPSLHRKIRDAAYREQTSINQFCVAAIESLVDFSEGSK